jgi:myo-inositol-1(or 4)-monophosphatase
LRAELSKARPGFGFLMEESGATAGTDEKHRWIVDPLDGTTNFLHGIPHFCISIALEREGELVAGVIYDPTRDEMFWAEKGAGAFMNDRRLRVAGRTKLDDSVIATGIPFRERGHHESYLETLGAVMAATAGVRRMGAAALDLAYVAAGRYDGFWEFGLSPWDIAAGIVLVREAGGQISDPGGGHDPLATGEIIASNVQLHPALTTLVRKGARRAA